MIAEKAADMIKGRQLEPYEPDHGSGATTPASGSAPLGSYAIRPASVRTAGPEQAPQLRRALGAQSGPKPAITRQVVDLEFERRANQSRPGEHYALQLDSLWLQPPPSGPYHLQQQQAHYQFVHNKYADSAMAGGILKRIS